jgi:hypothetical protein
MGGHAGDEDTPNGKLDEEEHVEPFQPQGFYREEIGGEDTGGLRLQELGPRRTNAPRRGSETVSLEQPSDRCRSDANTDLP